MRVIFSLLLALLLLVVPSTSAPQRIRRPGRLRGGRNGNGNGQTAQTGGRGAGGATNAVTPGVNAAFDGTPVGTVKTGTATDGSTVLDKTVLLNGLPIRYRVSGPASQFINGSGIQGATAAAGQTRTMGINVLLHGDGGQSFFDFPNQAVQQNLMGVVALAPDPNLFWGGGSGANRVDGVPHSAAVNALITQELPKVIAFNQSQTFFTGVSGGSLLLSGFYVPAFMSQFKTGVLLNCGALPPQVPFKDAAATISATTIHFQSTQRELALVQQNLPPAISAYEKLASQAGLSTAQIDALQTVNNSPDGGHCEFDEKDFVSGVQLMADNYANVIQAGGNGQVTGIGNVKQGVVGNENLAFSGATESRVIRSRLGSKTGAGA